MCCISVWLVVLVHGVSAQTIFVDNPAFQQYFSINSDAGPTFPIEDFSPQTPWAFLLHEVETGDFDGSGRQSVVVPYIRNRSTATGGLQLPTPVKLLRNRGDGTFADGAPLFGGNVPQPTFVRRVRTGDFDGSGRVGIFLGNTGLDTFNVSTVPPGELNTLLLPTTTGVTDASSKLPQSPAFTHALAVGDVDLNGSLDVYVGNLGGPEAPYMLLGDGKGGFTRRADVLPPEVGVLGPSRVTFLSAAFVDSLGRGVLDLALGGTTTSIGGAANNRIYRNDGHGDYSRSTPIPLPKGCFDPTTGAGNTITLDILPIDLAGRGRAMDLILAQSRADNTGACLQILINDGQGHYIDQSEVRGGSVIDFGTGAIWSVRAIDFNGDGYVDLLLNPRTIGSGSNRLALLRNDGMGRFIPAPNDLFPTFRFSNGGTSPYYQLIPLELRGNGKVSFVQPYAWYGAGVPSMKFAVYEQIKPYLPQTSIAYVQKAYVAYYGRPAEPDGLTYWASRMDAESGSLDSIIGAFGNSDEFTRRYGGLTLTALVTKIYQQALGRNPDPAGLAYYVGELEGGRRTLQSITLDVLNGATTQPDSTVVANKLDVAKFYTGKVAAGCGYGTEQNGVDVISSVSDDASSVTTAKATLDARCGF